MTVKKTTFLTKEAIASRTPVWASWMFKGTFLVTTAAIGYIAATNIIDQQTKYEVTIFLKLFVDPIVFGFSRLFGIEIKETN
jgi:hypothetical protein